MKELFKRIPQQQFAQYSNSHLKAGQAYQMRFHEMPGRAAMWELEQRLITDIFGCISPACALDFATGTGRIVSVLENILPSCEFHGIDISNDMVNVAREKCIRATFSVMDGRLALKTFGPESFDVVSAFRFFANAEPSLRATAAEQIAGLTKPGGHVVLNNHRNFWSTSYLLMRAAGHGDGSYGALNTDIKQLFLDNGFSCKRRFSLGVWPQTETRSIVLPWSATNRIERFNMRYLAQRHALGYNMIYVFQKGE